MFYAKTRDLRTRLPIDHHAKFLSSLQLIFTRRKFQMKFSEIATTEENEATTFTTEVFISNGTQPEELEPTTSAESLLTQTEPLTAAFTTHARTISILERVFHLF